MLPENVVVCWQFPNLLHSEQRSLAIHVQKQSEYLECFVILHDYVVNIKELLPLLQPFFPGTPVYHQEAILCISLSRYLYINITIQYSPPSSSFPPILLVIVLHFPPFACMIVLTSLGGASFDSLTGYLIWAAFTLATIVQTSAIALTHPCRMVDNSDRCFPMHLSAQRMFHA